MAREKVTTMKTDKGTIMERIVLTSENSKAVREAMDRMSAKLMKKNEKLYRRLADK